VYRGTGNGKRKRQLMALEGKNNPPFAKWETGGFDRTTMPIDDTRHTSWRLTRNKEVKQA